jgi:RNA polymerase sigma-70 factor (ECF subfamily)
VPEVKTSRKDDASSFAAPAFLSRLRAQDPLAIESVTHAYLPQILRAARGAGLDPQRAQDVTQSVFLTFIEGIARFEGRSHVRTWLFGILYRKLSETWRSVGREKELDDIDDIMEARFAGDGRWVRPPREADRATLDAEIRAGLAACLDEVPERQRLAFVLREVEGLTTAEICNALSVTDTNLGVLLFRVRNRLRECLEKRSLKG